MNPKRRSITLDEIKQSALRYSSRVEFAKAQVADYTWARRRGLLDEVCKHMTFKLNYWTIDSLKSEARKYSSRWEFQTNSNAAYQTAYKTGVLDQVCSHMEIIPAGHGFSRFKRDCDRNNEGYGTFYIIHCFDYYESFYKFGITSKTVEERYALPKTLPYNYDTMTEICAPVRFIWDLEKQYYSLTRSVKFIPSLEFSGMRECFKCHGNSKLLRL